MVRYAISYLSDFTTSALGIMCWLFLSVSVLIPVSGEAQPIQGNIAIDEGGKLWIEGTAGPVNFKCRAEKLSGEGDIENATNPQSSVKGHGTVHISVTLPVKSLNCGKRAMNKDMYEALKSDSFPVISYRLLNATLTEAADDSLSGSGWMNIRTRGIMEIAGQQDTTTINVKGQVFGDNKFRVKGSKKIHMDTYDIEPPSTMFGLIRANKQLTVKFDVTVTLMGQHN